MKIKDLTSDLMAKAMQLRTDAAMMNPPKERPILFSGPMVRAILEGRKSQTRRMVKLSGKFVEFEESEDGWVFDEHKQRWLACNNNSLDNVALDCPYGIAGDRLWVKETFARHPDFPDYVYRAGSAEGFPAAAQGSFKWKPSIFMPRQASRITLEIVKIRVEQLHEISGADAVAEGCLDRFVQVSGKEAAIMDRTYNVLKGDIPSREQIAIGNYRGLWESINGPGSWKKNPWVWVVEFQRLTNKG